MYFRFPWYSLLGYGLRCHRAIKEIAVLLGITDMRCKVRGPTTPLSLVRAAFQGLLSQVNTSWPLLPVFLMTCTSDIWSLLVTKVQGDASWRLYWRCLASYYLQSWTFSFQETHQELADRSGLNVVEFREECGMRPVIVASPSVESQRKVSKKREKKEYDLNEVFDPYRGLHRPKKRQELYWRQ